MAHPDGFLTSDLWDPYPPLTAREATEQGFKDGVINADEKERIIRFLPKPMYDVPPVEEPKPKETKYNLKDLRLTYCPWSGKQFADMSNDEIDANVDAYNPELREKALAYLKMRGYS